jgi:hypothetical protein
MANIYYILGIINLWFFIKRTINLKKYMKSLKTDPEFYVEEKKKSLITSTVVFVWVLLGLFTNQWLWFLIYVTYSWIMGKINRKNDLSIVENNGYNIGKAYLHSITHIALIAFPILNHFFFGIDINLLIKNIF